MFLRRITLWLLAVSLMIPFDAVASGPQADGGHTGMMHMADHLHCGVEWGYCATIWRWAEYTYVSASTQSSVSLTERDWTMKSNGLIYAYAGFDICRIAELDALFGYAGIYEQRTILCHGARVCCFPCGCNKDGIKVFGDILESRDNTFYRKKDRIYRAGSGYRLHLTRRTSLDLSVAFQYSVDHPRVIYDHNNKENADIFQLRRSNASYRGIATSLTISF